MSSYTNQEYTPRPKGGTESNFTVRVKAKGREQAEVNTQAFNNGYGDNFSVARHGASHKVTIRKRGKPADKAVSPRLFNAMATQPGFKSTEKHLPKKRNAVGSLKRKPLRDGVDARSGSKKSGKKSGRRAR